MSVAQGELVRVAVEGSIAVVTIDNPPVNSLTNDVLSGLASAAERLAADDHVRAIVLTGAGTKAFAAGADLDEFSVELGNRKWIDNHTALSRRAMSAWETLPKPVVAAVQANAMGGGLELALVCDLIVVDAGATLGLPEVRLGLIPGAGGTQRLPRRIGLGPAKAMILLGRSIDAAEAARLGLATRVAAPDQALAEARALAERLAALPGLALRNVKLALAAELEPGLDHERELFMEVFASEDAREGVAAFVEKRTPDFRHR